MKEKKLCKTDEHKKETIKLFSNNDATVEFTGENCVCPGDGSTVYVICKK